MLKPDRRTVLFRLPALAAATAALLALGACETTVPRSGFPEIGFAHLPPINVAVGRVDVVRAYAPPSKAPNVDHMFPVTPAATAERWARDRLKAVGGPGVLRAVIVNAAVVEVPLKQSGGLKGAFTTEQSERYDGEIEIRLEIETPGATANVTSRAQRRRTVPENISLADREKIWFQMVEAMMIDLNESLERQARKNFAGWIR
jgi:hypothetical protein